MQMIDARQPRFGQAVTGVVLATSFVLQWPPAIVAMAAVLTAAAVGGPAFNLYAHAFRLARRAGWVGPPRELEEPGPPRFANAVGSLFLGAASLLLLVGLPTAAWILAVVVAVLALLAAATGLCVGCELYVAARRVATRGRVRGRHTVPARSTGG
jgi:hypothetical protein